MSPITPQVKEAIKIAIQLENDGQESRRHFFATRSLAEERMG